MSPVSVSTCYSFSFASAIMNRIESLLIASNLKKMHADYCKENVIATTNIPTIKVLEAITTKKCQEKFHLESLETLGDSFLKYAACQQVFKMHQNKHEGILSAKKDRIISNAQLCKLGCNRKLPGFIRIESFDPKTWIVPGDHMEALHEVQLSPGRQVYTKGKNKIKIKVVADVVEALIGAFLSAGGEVAALSVMNWLGIQVDFLNVPYERSFPAHPEKLLNLSYLEPKLQYSFSDATLLVEAQTHGSYMLPNIPQCYQRLEFLGDSVLDYLITLHLYNKDIVFKSIRPLLDPLISPDSLKLQPTRELQQMCQKERYVMKKPVVCFDGGVASVTVEVEASDMIYKESRSAKNKGDAKKLASKAVLNLLKQSMPTEAQPTSMVSSPKGKNRKL